MKNQLFHSLTFTKQNRVKSRKNPLYPHSGTSPSPVAQNTCLFPLQLHIYNSIKGINNWRSPSRDVASPLPTRAYLDFESELNLCKWGANYVAYPEKLVSPRYPRGESSAPPPIAGALSRPRFREIQHGGEFGRAAGRKFRSAMR